MKKNQKTNLARFEVLKETKTGNLIGGFSNALDSKGQGSLATTGSNVFCGTNTNCHGANCIAGCGGGSQ
jgi:hypothetical protein